MTELDYGTLLCSATNKIGKQKHPCIFHIIAAGTYPRPRARLNIINDSGAVKYLMIEMAVGVWVTDESRKETKGLRESMALAHSNQQESERQAGIIPKI